MNEESHIYFRFDKLGSSISHNDFIDPNNPQLGYIPAKAMEVFSGLVNHMPVDQGDDLNIFLSPLSEIDSAYFYQILGPASAYVPEGTEASAAQSIMSSVGQLKGEGVKRYQNANAESLTGLMIKYKPSLASPTDWYNKDKNELWTNHSFQISESTAPPVQGKPQHNQLWRMKIDDAEMQKVLELPEPQPVAPNILFAKLNSQKPKSVRMMNVSSALVQPRETATGVNPKLARKAMLAPQVATRFSIHSNYLSEHSKLTIGKRLLVNQKLVENAPTQPSDTKKISISFDYCKVDINRPWYFDSFINNRSWCIPNVGKGTLNNNTNGSIGFGEITTAFVAIRNLSIEANWSTVDIENSKNATAFGPFKVRSEIVNNKLSHEGIQIIGWFLRKMPELPPNNAS